jgi:DNA-directed RNA polymerase specialized sigma24 family protein
MDDLQLVENIKKSKNTESSLKELVTRHSGIYYSMINRYVPDQSLVCSKADLMEERDFHIYNAALKFDSEKGTKFSTFLGNETKWLCLNSYNKAKKKYCEVTSPEDLDFLDKLDLGEPVDLNLLNEIFYMVERHPDHRVSKIFRLRYKDGIGDKLLPWKSVAPHVHLSIQGCINVHNSVIADIKNKLAKEEL